MPWAIILSFESPIADSGTNLNGLGFGSCTVIWCSVNDDCEVVYGRVSKLVAFFGANTEMETVIKVLQPGPLGIIEHKFSAEEIRKANTTVSKAVINWRKNAILEDNNHILKDYIHKYVIFVEIFDVVNAGYLNTKPVQGQFLASQWGLWIPRQQLLLQN
ncbi:hypothetical protein V8G54_020376 [Vigna mungo]|uniref:Uncharacterized protein n=1 Tax=Vigna mungo TaxID=3915 RepID=A0AAQ3NDL9_VIGMU